MTSAPVTGSGPAGTGPAGPATAVAGGRIPATAPQVDRVPAGDAVSADAVVTRGLTKRFPGGQVAVDNVDLAVPRGSVFGFLGPNGSGKTTSIRMLLGLVAPSAGTLDLLGRPMPDAAAEVLPRVGALVEGPAFHPYLSGAANLHRLDAGDPTAGRAGSRERVANALERVGLTAAGAKKYRRYSLGMRQRLGLAGALLRPRELFLLDEPTNGLDPQGTREVRALVREVAAEGATVFLSSHLLSEIELICTHVGVMSHGQLVFAGSMAELRAASRVQVRVETPDHDVAARVLRESGTGDPVTGPGAVSAELRDVASEDLTAALVRAGVRVRQLSVGRPDLEELFVGLTGEGFDVEQ